jgi:hypothetical protein
MLWNNISLSISTTMKLVFSLNNICIVAQSIVLFDNDDKVMLLKNPAVELTFI